MSQQIKTGILGLGRAGWDIHAAAIEKHAHFCVTAVADPESERRDEAVAKFGCRTYETPEQVLADPEVDLVVIATPSHMHGPSAIEAMKQGKHVLVEKPFATSAEEADEMIATAAATGRVLAPYHPRRMHPDFLKVQEVIRSGVLGPIHLIKITDYLYRRRGDWQTFKRFGGGMLNNAGAHFVDQALHLAGGQWHGLFADMRHVISGGDADDHVKVVFRGQDGIIVDVELSDGVAVPTPPHWAISGKYGAIYGSMTRLEWKFYAPASIPPRVSAEKSTERIYERPEDLPWVHHEIDLEPNDPSGLFYDALYGAIHEGKAVPASPQEIRNLIALFDACREQNPDI
jgi:predicted dehydrogenase